MEKTMKRSKRWSVLDGENPQAAIDWIHGLSDEDIAERDVECMRNRTLAKGA